MRKLKDILPEEVAGNITIDPTMKEYYGDGVLFQRKIDRLGTLLKGTKRDTAPTKPAQKA